MEFPSLETPAIIALKGLPCTNKTYNARNIATWARSPILLIDDFLGKLYPEGGETGDSSPTADEAERLHRVAFDILCEVAATQLDSIYTQFKCVVIKSRLCSTFELDRLIQLAQLKSNRPHPLLIIECQMRNEFRWRQIYNIDTYKPRWYKPKKWNEVEMARLNYDTQSWDLYFDQSIKELPDEHQRFVRRLVVDTTKDPTWAIETGGISNDLADAIIYLLTGNVDEMHKLQPVIEYAELRRSRMEQKLNSLVVKTKYHCAVGSCMLRYVKDQEWLDCEHYKDNFCSACEERISGPGYACHYCTLVLHTSCAEKPELAESMSKDIPDHLHRFPETHACNSCRGGGKGFSYECYGCVFQTHLKCRLMPTVVYHDSHPAHFLTIWLRPGHSICMACGHSGFNLNKYFCIICKYFCHPRCVALPREVKHEHGGYEHTMKLVYSLDDRDKEEPEDFWCDVCYKDMDPQSWFYSCRECPYYVTHLDVDSRLPCGSRLS